MTELELCQMSQRALKLKLDQVERRSENRLRRLKDETERRKKAEAEVNRQRVIAAQLRNQLDAANLALKDLSRAR